MQKNRQPVTVSSTMTFKVDGVANTATTIIAINNDTRGYLGISGQNSTVGITLQLPNTKVGTFTAYQDQHTTFGYFSDITNLIPLYTYVGTNGSATITSLTNDNVTGTFQFTSINANGVVKVISGGRFNCSLKQATN